ncbi:MAG: SDR family NAD(P)-dependent oxidoreductase [Rhodospirillaceae bacterium]|nr:SDR family NAD(P)-dependent oxidoreductase [Rhodospirillaceae bacterium]
MTHILITGASSGIGEALAERYAAPGITLSLIGRDPARTDDVARRCEARGARVAAVCIDVEDSASLAAWISARDGLEALDLVVANAGISAGTGGGGESAEQTRRIFAVNVTGVFNTVLPAIDVMRPRRRGQIAIMSSVAGFRGLRSAPAYCASKAAVRVWGEGLRGMLAPDNISVSVICPGFVESRMTAVNCFHMPFLMDTPRAAAIIARGLAARRGRISFPWPMAALTWMLAALPDAIAGPLTARVPGKPATG